MVIDHFAKVSKMVELGSGAKRKIDDYKLSRYACYLIVQNPDPKKEIVALGQTYFAIQTRKQELQEQFEILIGTFLKTVNYDKIFLKNLRGEFNEMGRSVRSFPKTMGINRSYLSVYE